MNRNFIMLLIALLLPTGAIAEETLVLARAPQLSASVTAQQWTPFVKYLSEQAGVEISLKVYTERSKFEDELKAGKVALYFGNPGYGIVGHLKHGYMPLVRSDRKLLEGIVVVRKDKNIEKVKQLNTKVIAFPAETAFAASLLLRAQLKNEFNLDYQPLYAGSHGNAYRAVLIGKAAAAGGVKRTFEHESVAVREQLNIIYTTPGMKQHPLMVHPAVSGKVRRLIQDAILKLNKSDAGKKMLKSVKLRKPVVAEYVRDYKSIEPLATKMYQSLLD